MSTDWSSLFGVATPAADPASWIKSYYATKKRAGYLQQHCEIVVLAVDSAFWQCFTNDADLLQAFSSHLQLDGMRVEPCRLGDCRYL